MDDPGDDQMSGDPLEVGQKAGQGPSLEGSEGGTLQQVGALLDAAEVQSEAAAEQEQ